MRAKLRQDRIYARLDSEFKDEGGDVLSVSPELRDRIGVPEGTLIEMVTPKKASVRAWLAVRRDLSGLGVSMNPDLRRALNIEVGETVWVRTLS